MRDRPTPDASAASGAAPPVAVVSGGSRGLGLAVARLLLGRGVAVATFARSGTDAVARLGERASGRLRFAECDVSDAPSVAAFMDGVEEALGVPTLLINNAGIGQDHLLSHLPDDRLRAILDVNFYGATVLTRRFVQGLLLAGRKGRIVNVSSVCGSHGFPGLSAYSGTKAALEAMTRALARELGPRGITVNAVAPGFFESEMSAVLAPHQVESIRRRTPLGRLVTEEDVLPVIELLAFGPEGVNGQVITVDGGLTA